VKLFRLQAENNLKEENIRPKQLFDEFLRLSEENADHFFMNVPRHDCNCPGCGSNDNDFTFEKRGFQYCTCHQCDSLFVNPRPAKEAFNKFYTESNSTKYFAEKFLPNVIESRRQHIFVPRVKQTYELTLKENIIPNVVLEIGAGHCIFLEEWGKTHPDTDRKAVEPNPIMAQYCRDLGLSVLESTSEDAKKWHNVADLVVSFEVLEHATDPLEFVLSLQKFVRPGGLLIATGLSGDGFDIKILGEKSKNISPPHHLNFCSVDGYYRLFTRAGLEEICIQTPGKLDVEIVSKAIKDNTLQLSEFEKLLLNKKPKILKNSQNFLSDNQLSSHCWITAKKPVK